MVDAGHCFGANWIESQLPYDWHSFGPPDARGVTLMNGFLSIWLASACKRPKGICVPCNTQLGSEVLVEDNRTLCDGLGLAFNGIVSFFFLSFFDINV